MMDLPESLPHEYLVIQRCRAYHSWPSEVAFTEWQLQRLQTNEALHEVFMRFQVGSGLRDLALLVPKSDQTLMLGNHAFCRPGSTTDISFQKQHLEPGMVDFVMKIKSHTALDEELLKTFAYKLRRFVAFCSVYFDDVFIPVLDVYTLKIENGSRSREGELSWTVMRRHLNLTQDDIKELMQDFISKSGVDDEESWCGFNVAARRYLTAMAEEDPVDKFCDLWEACEFLTKGVKGKNGKRAGSDIASRIAYALSDHMNVSKKKIERKYIRPFWEIRKDLVHNAVEEEAKVRDAVFLLERLVAELLRYKVGLGFLGAHEVIDKVIEATKPSGAAQRS